MPRSIQLQKVSPFARSEKKAHSISLAFRNISQAVHTPSNDKKSQFDGDVNIVMGGQAQLDNQAVQVLDEHCTGSHQHVEIHKKLRVQVGNGIVHPILHLRDVRLESGELGNEVDERAVSIVPAIVQLAQGVDGLAQSVDVSGHGGDGRQDALVGGHGEMRRLEGLVKQPRKLF